MRPGVAARVRLGLDSREVGEILGVGMFEVEGWLHQQAVGCSGRGTWGGVGSLLGQRRVVGGWWGCYQQLGSCWSRERGGWFLEASTQIRVGWNARWVGGVICGELPES